jgi:hypothetical protein
VIFLAGLTVLKKVRCLGVVSGCRGDPVVALHLRNAADYNVKYAVGTNNSTVEQLVVVLRERTTTLESEQHHQMLLQFTYQRVTITSLSESLAQPLNSYALGRLPCIRRH